MYQAPDYLAPLEVDKDQIGADSDRNIIMLNSCSINSKISYPKKSVVTRPLPEAGIVKFGKFLSEHSWDEVIEEQNIDKKVENFHRTLRQKLDEIFPEKTVKISTLDKKWMTPELKSLNRKAKREFYLKRKSERWKT